MTDRQPGAPGQYILTVSASEAQNILIGQPVTVTLVRDDQPLVEGTPYNKASVLPDVLAKIICPNVSDPNPADALRGLHKRGYFRNLLDNSDFTHFVAQAGIGGNHGTQIYAGDRWILDSGTVTGEANETGDGYRNITLNGTIRQIVANPPAVGSVGIEMISGTADVSYADGAVTITSAGGVLKNVSLFEGEYTADAFPAYKAKGYGAEQQECMRYFRRLASNSIVTYPGHITGTTRATFLAGYSPFAAVPTAVMSSDFKITVRLGTGGYSAVTSINGAKPKSVVGTYRTGSITTVYFEFGAEPGTNNMVVTSAIMDGHLDLCADL